MLRTPEGVPGPRVIAMSDIDKYLHDDHESFVANELVEEVLKLRETIRKLEQRLAKDPWKDAVSGVQDEYVDELEQQNRELREALTLYTELDDGRKCAPIAEGLCLYCEARAAISEGHRSG